MLALPFRCLSIFLVFHANITFLQYKISREDLTQNTLWVSVWNWDITGTNKFLGEVVVPLNSSELDLSSSKDLKYTLQVKNFFFH